VQGTQKGHGEGGAKFATRARAGLGLPADKHFYVSDEVKAYFAGPQEEARPRLQPLAQGATRPGGRRTPSGRRSSTRGRPSRARPTSSTKIPLFAPDVKLGGTRAAGRDVLQPLAAELPLLIGGSADLYGSTLNYIAADKDFDATNRSGRNIRFGIREHGMAAIANGIAYDGIFRPSIATFLVFADYSRPPMRLAALSKLPVVYIYTHDSIGVGEDGPTHEPVETISALRLIPNMEVIRPADPRRPPGAFAAALERTDGPTLIALSRQAVPVLNEIIPHIRGPAS
jgi:transketolase